MLKSKFLVYKIGDVLKNNKRKNWMKIFHPLAVVIFLLHAQFSQAQIADVDPPMTSQIEYDTDIEVIPPTNTFYGTRGLSQTASAEALGMGRLIFGVQGAWYQQQQYFTGGPNLDASIFTGIGAVSFGLNPYVDIFASLAGYGSMDYDSSHASGLGSVGVGLQGTLPFSPSAPVRMAAQVSIYQGLSENAINSNHADGYNYFETRTGLDFMARIIQTLVFGSENLALKVHFNEGLVTSMESGADALILAAAGAQINVFFAVLGLEANSRTPIKDIDFASDPLWITPSLQFRTAYNINLTLGADVAVSQERSNVSNRALEPYRLFGGLAFTFDTDANKRQQVKDKARQEELAKQRLQFENRELAGNMLEQSREDSIAQLRQRQQSDSLAAVMAEKARLDSLEMADRANRDSLALLESERNLAEEKSKRSEAEKQLLSTGLLLLDAVYFETNKTNISLNSEPYLNIIAKMLLKYPKLEIEVGGHTDGIGSDENNLKLSQARAKSVLNYMVKAAPELAGVLTAKGYGESEPKGDNKTADGRQLNRRTELMVLNKNALSQYNP